MTFRTPNLYEASALLSQIDFQVDFVELEPTAQENKYKFVLEINASSEEFDKWRLSYMNNRVKVNPKDYDSALNLLRDNLKLIQKIKEKEMSENPKENPKSRGEEVVKETPDDTERYLNLGIPVELSFGKYTVKELDVISLMSLVASGLETFVGIGDENSNDMDLLKKMATKPETRDLIGRIFAMYCDAEDATPFKALKLRDFNKLYPAIKKVTDFEEIKGTFLVMGLQEYLPVPISTEQTTTPKPQV